MHSWLSTSLNSNSTNRAMPRGYNVLQAVSTLIRSFFPVWIFIFVFSLFSFPLPPASFSPVGAAMYGMWWRAVGCGYDFFLFRFFCPHLSRAHRTPFQFISVCDDGAGPIEMRICGIATSSAFPLRCGRAFVCIKLMCRVSSSTTSDPLDAHCILDIDFTHRQHSHVAMTI